jgi:Ca-activated chloride channel family protein
MFKKHSLILLAVIGSFICSPLCTKAQNQQDEIVRVKTRVVFIDTLVIDRTTGMPVGDLTREDFEVRADGRPRELSYFSRASEGRRRPLAILLVVDLVSHESEEYRRRADVLKSLAAAFQRLSAEDEVAIVANLGGPGAQLKTLSDFTHDRKKITEALTAIQSLPAPQASWYRDQLDNVLKIAEDAAAKRPNSQIIIVTLSNPFGPMRFSDRDKMVARLIRINTTFSPLIREVGAGSIKMHNVPGKFPTPPRPVFATLGRLMGNDMYAPGHIAEQTGGNATIVRQPEDYGTAVEKFITSLAARYDLGFTLKENEQDDGRMHKLEVRIRARDSKGKDRKLVARARRGYYLKIPEPPVNK